MDCKAFCAHPIPPHLCFPAIIPKFTSTTKPPNKLDPSNSFALSTASLLHPHASTHNEALQTHQALHPCPRHRILSALCQLLSQFQPSRWFVCSCFAYLDIYPLLESITNFPPRSRTMHQRSLDRQGSSNLYFPPLRHLQPRLLRAEHGNSRSHSPAGLSPRIQRCY